MKASFAQLDVRKGARIEFGSQEYVITHVPSLSQVIARNLVSDNLETLSIADIRPPSAKGEQTAPAKDLDLVGVSKEDWDEAKRRLKIIQPLLRVSERGKAEAHSIATKSGIGTATLYRWRRSYLNSGLLSSLLPGRPDGGKGKPRLKNKDTEEALRQTIENYYLTDSKPSLEAAWEYLDTLCQSMNIRTPHMKTLRLRVRWRNQRSVVAAREGERVANMLFDPIEGKIGDAEWPLAMVEVDHTELPVMIVHEVTRQQIRRPWVTL